MGILRSTPESVPFAVWPWASLFPSLGLSFPIHTKRK